MVTQIIKLNPSLAIANNGAQILPLGSSLDKKLQLKLKADNKLLNKVSSSSDDDDDSSEEKAPPKKK